MHPVLRRHLTDLGLSADETPSPEQWSKLVRFLEEDESLVIARGVHDSVVDGILVADTSRRVLLVNQRFAEMWELREADVEPGSDTSHLFEKIARLTADPDATRAIIERTLGEPGSISRHDITMRDGRIFERYVAPLRMGNGSLLGCVVSYRDVTSQRRVPAERLALAERLAAVVAGAAHEINNPLAYVIGNVELVFGMLRTGETLDAHGAMEALAEALVGLERIRVIVRDLRTLSRMDDDDRTFADLRAIVDRAVEITARQTGRRPLVAKRFTDVPPVLANEARLVQVMVNLLDNAARAVALGDDGERTVTVSTSTTPRGWAAVEVEDNGIGIAEADLGRVFDPFYTTKPVGSGSGLGLSVCKGIVESLGGTISVASAPGRGARFVVELPPAPDDAQ